jgi:thiol:disulfide interchange protein DsbA
MKIVSRCLLLVLIPFVACGMAVAGSFVEGKDYQKLKTPQPTASSDSIEVVELFWYGCPHCYRLEPFIHDWLKNKPDDVSFVRMPAIMGSGWELLAKAYYTAELLGVLDKVHGELFSAVHEKNSKIRNEKMLREFFVGLGVPAEDFDKTINSFAVVVKINNARMMTRRYGLTGVPTVIVNGKFSTSASAAGSNKKLIDIIDYLVAEERKLAAAPAADIAGNQP